ncbi:MAG: Wzz/FepE/Etk N-terminal domain-containing protein, partial [Rhizobiaceae bacterium]|nr:Wzz/FepE/Etk N-terminal domain-containing protein [Rhizobiaceae bacterium]
MDIDIFQLPGILRRRLHYVILTVVVCLALAFIYVLRLTPLYTSSTELLLDPKGLVTGGADPVNVMAPAPQDQPAVDSQIYVMQSRATLEEVVSKLDLVKDPFFAAAVKKAKNDRDRLMAVVTVLKAHVTIERAGQSLVFSISAEHPNAATAADIANSIAAVYLRQLDEARASAARRASSSFQLQASELRDRVLKAELAVEKFKAENGLVSTGQQGLVIDQQVAGL